MLKGKRREGRFCIGICLKRCGVYVGVEVGCEIIMINYLFVLRFTDKGYYYCYACILFGFVLVYVYLYLCVCIEVDVIKLFSVMKGK